LIGIDTNVLIRFLVEDDADQSEAVRKWMAMRDAEIPAYVSTIVLAETVWVLSRRLKFPMKQVTNILRDLLAADGLVFEETERLDALLHNGEPATDLADYLISWQAAAAGCSYTVSFDRQAAGAIPEMELLA
tara:strand:+ start:1305 stop:1700 length:396 start_codon:yes stop_codon:yes gene_type:complete